ncbi:CPBP family intramembrane metalloprotease [Halolamina sp. CBA1230]|uniref:CPBP family glutamic-type intramembrane protease n=1 Tax=Halolamina sp. CBA1230 TaxID=1853690 RepID=UPI0009A22411|nr:CPBP family intramembrane glutamic endopeptidase [Halolamina sp. CBA1230]QKY21137.1 CPBP family intramembrane metalloprotease [Halolamina sp. CBA1230]
MPPLTTLAGVAVAFGGYPALRNAAGRIDLLSRLPGDETTGEDTLKWLVTGAVLAFVLFVENAGVRSIGARLPDPIPVLGVDGVAGLLGWWILGVFGTLVLSTVAYNVFRHFDLDTSAEFAAEQADRSTPAFLFTAATAGVTESVLYQGYPIGRLADLTGSLLLAGAVAWVAFTAVHYATGRFSVEGTLFTSAPALAMTVLYVLSGSVYVVVLAHATVNVLTLVSQ